MAQLGINHKDIKPKNMLITKDKNLKIIDFGISEKTIVENNTLKTGSYSVLGTQGYMAPELENLHSRGEIMGYFSPGKADVFSLGITLFQIITLEQVAGLNLESSNPELMRKVDNLEVETWVKIILKQMLELNPKKRPSFKTLLRNLPGKFTTSGRTILS